MKRKKYRYVVIRCAKYKSRRTFSRQRGTGEIALRAALAAIAAPWRQFGTKTEAKAAAKMGNTKFAADAIFKVFRVERVL